MSIHSVRHTQTHLTWDHRYISIIITLQRAHRIKYPTNSQSVFRRHSHIHLPRRLQLPNPLLLHNRNSPQPNILPTRPSRRTNLHRISPGDVLQIEVLEITTAEWGWTAIILGFGILNDEFPDPQLKIWKFDPKVGYAWFDEARGIKIPLSPFAGIMGLAHAKPGATSTIPPYRTGGNLDVKWLGRGAKLFLPVEMEGALFSVGDGHAAQLVHLFVLL